MKNNIFIILLIQLISCDQPVREDWLYNELIDKNTIENFSIYDHITDMVQNKASRPADVELVNMLRDMYEHRRRASLLQSTDSGAVTLNNSEILDYIQYIKSNFNGYDIDDIDFEELAEAAVENRTNVKRRDQETTIKLLLIEARILTKVAQLLGGYDGFCNRFKYDYNSDTIIVGELHKSIISTCDIINKREEVSFDSLYITLGDNGIKFESEVIGSSVHLKFVPSQTGKYIIGGKYTTKYLDFDYNWSCPFHYQVVAVEQ